MQTFDIKKKTNKAEDLPDQRFPRGTELELN